MKTTQKHTQKEENEIEKCISTILNSLEQLLTHLLHYSIALAKFILPLVLSSLTMCLSLTTVLISRRHASTNAIEQRPLSQSSTSQECKYPFITDHTIAHEVIEKLSIYLKDKERCQPKDIMMPFRAAQEAGVIRRITHKEMKEAFPHHCPSSTTSVSYYTTPDTNPYHDVAAYRNIVEDFAHIAKAKEG